MNKQKLGEYSLYLWLLFWPWQTKLILVDSSSNYLQIALFASWFLLLIPILVWVVPIFKQDYWRFKKNNSKPLWWLGIILIQLSGLLSIFFARDISLALYHYITLTIGLILFFILKSESIKIKYFSLFFISGLIAPALLGIWQFFAQKTIAWKWLGLAVHLPGDLGSSVIETIDGRYLRAYGSFDHPNVLGGIMAIALIYILYISLKEKIDQRLRLLYIFSFSVFYCALLLSFSRSGLLAFLIAAPLLFFKYKKTANNLLIAYSCLIILISAVIIIPYKDLFLVRSTATGRLEQKSLTERTAYVEQAWSLIKVRSLQGVGLGNYTLALPDANQYSQPVHNYWLLLWSEIGIFGLLGALVFWFYLLATSYSKNLYPIVIVLFIFSLLDHWLWSSGLGLLFFFTISALINREEM